MAACTGTRQPSSAPPLTQCLHPPRMVQWPSPPPCRVMLSTRTARCWRVGCRTSCWCRSSSGDARVRATGCHQPTLLAAHAAMRAGSAFLGLSCANGARSRGTPPALQRPSASTLSLPPSASHHCLTILSAAAHVAHTTNYSPTPTLHACTHAGTQTRRCQWQLPRAACLRCCAATCSSPARAPSTCWAHYSCPACLSWRWAAASRRSCSTCSAATQVCAWPAVVAARSVRVHPCAACMVAHAGGSGQAAAVHACMRLSHGYTWWLCWACATGGGKAGRVA